MNRRDQHWMIITAFAFAAILITMICTSARSARTDMSIILARSCVGEAGWNAVETGECASIWHIYLKRSRIGGLTLRRATHVYSAALKSHSTHRRPWLMQLSRDGLRPKEWPSRASWKVYRDRWMLTVAEADRFVAKQLDDPTPDALHFGGWLDRHRLDKKVWEPYRPEGYRNTLYRRR